MPSKKKGKLNESVLSSATSIDQNENNTTLVSQNGFDHQQPMSPGSPNIPSKDSKQALSSSSSGKSETG
jgi:hypothetical protein